MDILEIEGGHKLQGEITISGSKNASLPLLAATLLTDQKVVLKNIPNLADIDTMEDLLANHGANIARKKEQNIMEVEIKEISSDVAPYDIVRKMRASILVLGPILARVHKAKVSLPGGCSLGTRPVDLHLRALEKMGANIKIDNGYVIAEAPNGLNGADIVFSFASVGATENIVMAACLANGKTTIKNVAKEPEIVDLCNMLVAMGAEIEGIGSDSLEITGKKILNGCQHKVIADRIEAGTYAIAALNTKGDILLKGVDAHHLDIFWQKLETSGAGIDIIDNENVRVFYKEPIVGTDILTEPYPGYPTDLQAQWMALMTTAQGASMITEAIFENRFMHVPELKRMNANITVQGRSAIIRGKEELVGAEVMATDLRASVSLVIAALSAKGLSTINRLYHLDRGYENLEEKLSKCGAKIKRVKK